MRRFVHKFQKRETLQAMPEIDPIPIRPPGYFAGSYSEAEIKEQNQLAKASVINAPKGLE